MTQADNNNAYIHHVVEMMSDFGPVEAKRMFGGYGIFLDGLMFALVADNTLYLKADKESEMDFIKHNLPRFSYQRQGKTTMLSYYQAPEEVLEDTECMQHWARIAYDAALRGAR